MSFDGTLKFDTAIDTKGFVSSLGSLGSLVSKTMLAAGAAVLGLGTAAAKVGMDFETAASQIAATMGKPKSEIQDIIDEAARLGRTTAFTATEAAEGFNILAMSGLEASDQIAVASDMLNLAAAGGLSLDNAATYLTGTIKGFNQEFDGTINGIKTAQYVADLLATGASKANTSVDGLGAALSDSAASAGSYNQSIESTTVALLRLAEQNVTGTAASTALSAAMKNLYTPSKQAAEVLDQLGVSAYTAEGAERDFNDVVDDLTAALADYTPEQRNAYKQTIFGIQGLEAYNKMTVSSAEKVNKFKDALGNASEGVGAASEMAAEQINNLRGKITILKSGLEGLGVSLYKEMQAPLSEAAGFATELVGDLQAAFDEGGLSSVVEAAGGVVSKIVTKITQEAPKLIDAAATLIHSFCESLKNTDGLSEAAGKLITSLVSAFLSVTGDLLSLGAHLVVQLAKGIMNSMSGLTKTGVEMIKSVTAGIKSTLPEMISLGLNSILEFSRSLRSNFGTLVDAGIDMVLALADSIIESIPTIIQTVPEIITNFCGLINDNAPKLIKAGITIIKNLAKGLIDAIPVIKENIPKIIKAITSVWEAVNWLNLGKQIIQGITKGVTLLKEKLPDVLKSIGKKAKEIFTSIDWHSVGKSIITLAWEGIKAVAHLIPNIVKTIGNAALTVLKTLPKLILEVLVLIFNHVVEWGESVHDKATDAVKETVASVNKWFSQLPGKIWKWLSDIIVKVITWGATVYERASTAVKNTINSVNDWFSQLPGKIWTWLSDIINKVIAWGADLFSKASTAASDTISKVNEWFSTLPGKIWIWLSDIISKIIVWGADLLSKASTAASDTVAKVNEWFSTLPGKIWTWLQNIISNVITWAADLLSKCSTAASDAVSKMNEWFSGLPGKIWTHLQAVITNVTTWASDLLSKCGTAASDAVAKVVEWFSGLPGKVQTHLDSVISKVTSWASDLAAKGAEAAKGLYDAVIDTITDLPGRVYSVGQDIVSGIWSGISDSYDWIKDKIVGWVGDVESWFKSVFGIGSPSRLMADSIGKWLPPGIGEGFDEAMPDLIKQMDRDVDALVSKMQHKVDLETAGISVKQQAAGEHNARTEVHPPAQNYHEEKFVQNNTYNTPVASPSEVSKAQREAARKLLGGVK